MAGPMRGRSALLAAALAILLGSTLSTWAIADEPNPDPPTAESPSVPQIPPLGRAEVSEAYEATKRKEEERSEELQQPRFVAERKASRNAYADLNAPEAEQLLRSTFGQELERLNGDPARFLTDAKVDRTLGDGAALVTSEGQTEIMEGTMPVRAENEEGDLEVVDLSLEGSSETGFEPENSLVGVSIGGSAEEGVEIGDDGLEIKQAGARDVQGQLFGDKNVFFGEVQEGTDIDLFAAPTASGIELFDMLRSVDSPDDIRFNLDLPEGASLHPEVGGGAAIWAADGTSLAVVAKPYGTDAQGTYVPVTLEIEGSSTIVLRTHHREEDLAYPILVDPEVVYQNWSNPSWYNNQNLQGFGAWRESYNAPWVHLWTSDSEWPGHRGLVVATENGNLSAGGFAEWELPAQNINVYMTNVVVSPFWRGNQTCSAPNPYPEPYDFEGMYDSAQGRYNVVNFNNANKYGNSDFVAYNPPGTPTWGHLFVFGLQTSSSFFMPCWRNLIAGGVSTWYGDWDAPELTSVVGKPSGWIKMDQAKRTLNVSAYDSGLGVQTIRLFGIGGREYPWNQSSCAGTYENRCANSRSGTITYETSGSALYEGEQTFTVQALDPVKQGFHSQQFPVKLDGLAPLMTVLPSQLGTMTGEVGSKEQPQGEAEKLRLPVYNLKLRAEDGTEKDPRSGVQNVRLYMDGALLATKSSSCSSSCPRALEWTYPVQLTGLTEGKHTLEIGTVDLVGNEVKPQERKIEFTYIPATGDKGEYVLQHFLLPDGNDYTGEPDYSGPELAVNVTNGNLIYRQRDLKVDAPSGALELERVYNSQQPAARDGQWGHGWSIAQTPELKPESAQPTATMAKSGVLTAPVKLPESQSQEVFNNQLHATLSKTVAGSYEVDYETEPETAVFNASGRIEETQLGDAAPAPSAVLSEPPSPLPIGIGFASSFGSAGTLPGKIKHPADVDVDSKGNIWVLDKGNNRIQQFNESGEFLRAVGSGGSARGRFGSPSALAVDPSDNVWVADTANNRIQEFNEKGEFLAALGKDVNKTKVAAGASEAERNYCSGSDVCQPGAVGSAPGQLSAPQGIAVTSGAIWVADTGHSRIEKFAATGGLLSNSFSEGSAPGQLKGPTALEVGPDGSLWVADSGNDRVEHWDSSLNFLLQFGGEGTADGQFDNPDALDVDPAGNLWVADDGNDRLQKFSESGEFMSAFGAPGSGNGQFSFSAPIGIAVDGGKLWVADADNNRVQQLEVGNGFGSAGNGDGQFTHPAGIAVASGGNLWIVDRDNKRLEKFSQSGEFLGSFGTAGVGSGQLSRPTDVAIDSKGNLWVVDAGNNRIETFDEAGQFLGELGSGGSGSGQFNGPEAIAIANGHVWVADTYNGRLQEFSEAGAFIRTVGTRGTGTGQMLEPTGVAIGPGNKVWLADWGNNRIAEFNEEGAFVRQFGTSGAGDGQFQRPGAIEVDREGRVWVADQNNARIQGFDQSGTFVTKFGTAGSASGQFNFASPMGIAADLAGRLWVSDSGSNRIQGWVAPTAAVPGQIESPAIEYSYSSGNLSQMKLDEPLTTSDPAMNVSTSSGFTSSITAESAGAVTYSYEGSQLKSATNPQGETKFEKDASNRLRKVELPNGTWAKIEYDSYSRVVAVTVKATGESERKTQFWYGAEPRETKVWGGGNPEITYSIAEDGSVLQWSYAESPPKIASITGSLWGHRNDPTPVENKDQTLGVTAESTHEIASIKVLVNGTSVVAETTCEDKAQPPDHHCDRPEQLEWITNPSEHAAGRLDLEIVATDFLGHSSGERFFVTIPQQPPPDPEAPEKPSFASIRDFRERYGLDREHPLSQPQMNRLILELLYEWEAQLPTAMASVASWGTPMRAPELAEMNYRREYTNNAAEVIPEWAEEHAPSSYGGFYVDDRAGGLIYVGFTENQHALVEALKQAPGLINAGAILEYSIPPTSSISSLNAATLPAVTNAIDSVPSIDAITSSIHVAPEGNVVEVGSTDPNAVLSFLTAHFGQGAPIRVTYEAPPVDLASRYGSSGPLVAGSGLIGFHGSTCTSGFNGRVLVGVLRGKAEYKYFVLTAGHCYGLSER